MRKVIDRLIVNSPYEEPTQYWDYVREKLDHRLAEGRRPAGYKIFRHIGRGISPTEEFIELPLVNKIRERIGSWRAKGYAGVTGTTRRLLEHWQDKEERGERPFFFCQLEAIETLIWLTEAPETEKAGIDIPGNGGDFVRWCCKMATGSGKTIVMGMILAWHFLNKVSYPKDKRFSKHALVVAPGLTVKNRLQVLLPSHPENYYEVFNIVPAALRGKLRQGKVVIHNWHVLSWDTQEQLDAKRDKGYLRSVDKRKHIETSDKEYVRRVLRPLGKAKNLIVLNDEAHHAWQVSPEVSSNKDVTKETVKEATVWVGGLDRIHRKRGILKCFDLSATPFVPSDKMDEKSLFPWIVSDFGLNDAIEAGLVKTPRIVVRDNSWRTTDYMSRLYHIYADQSVSSDIKRNNVEKQDPLPDLIIDAYNLLGADWKETKKKWEEAGQRLPPVMITVANGVETSARIKHTFETYQIDFPDLCAPEGILQIDSKVLREAESEEMGAQLGEDNNGTKRTKKEQAEYLRQQVNTVGKAGEVGECIQNVISVGMLSEGWDAKTVTHIMGLRAFSSQLLCEQVVGRGLRRVSYDLGENGLFVPEYVNVFGIPFSFLLREEYKEAPLPQKPLTRIEPSAKKAEYEISWPNIDRVGRVYKPQLELEWSKLGDIHISNFGKVSKAELAAIVEGKPHSEVKKEIDLKRIIEGDRIRSTLFHAALKIYNTLYVKRWKGSKRVFIAQMINLVERFIYSRKMHVADPNVPYPTTDSAEWKAIIKLNMHAIVQHICEEVRVSNMEKPVAEFNKEHPVCFTGEMKPWYTSKPCEIVNKSHISHCVCDSRWEATEAYGLDSLDQVAAFVKNDHLGFYIYWRYDGIVRKYYPDFIVRLANGEHLILEVKGVDTEGDKVKRSYLEEWVEAVNESGGFGTWHCATSFHPGDLESILAKLL